MRTFDRRLREALEARGRSTVSRQASQGCLDAQTLAAWADNALAARERARAEAHASDCADCQARLAALIKTTPASDTARPWWRAPTLGWLVPLTAAAAAILIWAIVPPRVMPGRAIAQPGTPAAPVGETTPPAPTLKELPASEPGKIAAPGETFARRRPPDAPRTEAKSNVEARSSTDTLRRLDAKPGTETDAAASPAPVSPAPVPPASAPPTPTAPPSTASRSAAAAGAIAGGVAGGVVRARSESDIMSPDRRSRWRIAPAGAVQHSLDGGASWETQQTGVAIRLTAGASPSASVCWVVGPRGIVLETKDGRSWRRLDFPESVDLVSVRATDDQTATVGAADGRTFSTVDGGLTWTAQENLSA